MTEENSDNAIPFLSDFDKSVPLHIAQESLSYTKKNAKKTRDMDSPKLHKVLADGGMGSRREMEELILSGRISVNGTPAHIGQRIAHNDQVRVNGRLLKVKIDPPLIRVLAYHKPVGEIVSRDDPEKRPSVFKNLPKIKGGRWIAVGRLDINTEGLILFSNSGDLANRLMHPRNEIEREYAVRLYGEISDEKIERLLAGIEFEEGFAKFKKLELVGGGNANVWVRVLMAEGKRREVRRLFEAVDITVSRLIRIRYGVVSLPENLRRGRSIELTSKAIEALLKTVGMRQVGVKKNNSWRKGKPSDNSRLPFGASLSSNVRGKNLGAKRAQLRSKVGLTDQNTIEGTNSYTAAHELGDEDSQPKSLDAHLSKLGGPMRKPKRVGRRPNPLQTSWGLATNSSEIATGTLKNKKSRPARKPKRANKNARKVKDMKQE
ncbi:MAG: pseudouridine synthase [Burkholderiaceae bacterium]|nr:MAG: pseudouridine synthase [Burkholderiaceae bacterium]